MLLELDHIEFFVGNAFQSAMFYKGFFDFDIIALRRTSSSVSYAIKQGEIVLVFTSSTDKESKITKHVSSHGDSIKAIVFKVSDSKKVWNQLIKNGASPAFSPKTNSDTEGFVTTSGIEVYGEVIHVLLDRNDYKGTFLPNYKTISKKPTGTLPSLFSSIDHFTAIVEEGKLDFWIEYYEKVFGFSLCFSTHSFAEGTGMKAKVVKSKTSFLFPITEPYNTPNSISQFQKFLIANKGPGIQHISFTTEDIIQTMRELQKRGIDILEIPSSYYQNYPQDLEVFGIDLDNLKELNILVEKDKDGILFQAFTIPLLDRPTFFIEIIQRKGANLFGKGNVDELFKALTSEQKNKNLT